MRPVVQFKNIFLSIAFATLSSTVLCSPVAENNAVQPVDDLSGISAWKSISSSVFNERSSTVDDIVVPRDEGSLEKRVFTSPHMKRAFKVVVGNAISAATWVIDFSLNEVASGQATLHYKLQSTSGLVDADAEIPSLRQVFKTPNQYRGNAQVELLGKYAGKVVQILFNGEIFASDAAMIWQRMLEEPVCYINGVKSTIKSWTFDQV